MPVVRSLRMSTNLVPYVFFYGRCSEALAFYKTALGGSYDVMTVAESPMKDQMPPEAHGGVMHATFTAPGITFMAADGMGHKKIDPDAGNIALCINVTDDADGERMYKALADGGNPKMPFGDAPWGGKFGMLIDRFGNEWMVSKMSCFAATGSCENTPRVRFR
jgi:PhnB protein